MPLVLSSLAAEDPLLQATAMQLAGRLPGNAMTTALVERLPQLDAAGQVLLLGVLAQRGDRAAAAAVVKQMENENEAVRAAAVATFAKLGDASLLKRLVELAATGGGAVPSAAQSALATITGADIEPALVKMAGGRRRGVARGRLPRPGCEALGRRRASAAARQPKPDPQVRTAALDALAAVAGADSYGPLVALLVAATTPADAQAAERAVLEAGSRLTTARSGWPRCWPLWTRRRTKPSRRWCACWAGSAAREALAAVRRPVGQRRCGGAGRGRAHVWPIGRTPLRPRTC